jgi:sRNA-binding protein
VPGQAEARGTDGDVAPSQSRSELRRRQAAERERAARRNALGALLAETFPQVFAAPVPLVIGIREEIASLVSPEYSLEEVDRFLRYWTLRDNYLRSLALGESRLHLDGSISGRPSRMERRLAATQLQKKQRVSSPAGRKPMT